MQQAELRVGGGAALVRALILVLLAGVPGVWPGEAHGQSAELRAAECAVDCTARGYEGEYCARVCEVADFSRRPPVPPVDWRCAEACRDNGGGLRDCVQRCPMR